MLDTVDVRMRRDRCVLVALVLIVAALAIGHHTYIDYVIPATPSAVDPEQPHVQQVQQQQLLLRASVFDDLEGYGGAETKGAAGNDTSKRIAEIEQSHEQVLQELRSDIAQRNVQLERLTGELDTLRIENAKQSEQLVQNGATTSSKYTHIGPIKASAPCDARGIFVGEDIVGSDISDSVAVDALECCQRCTRHQRVGSSCLGWTFVGVGAGGGSQGRCYLKSSTSPVRYIDLIQTPGSVDRLGLAPIFKLDECSETRSESCSLVANEALTKFCHWNSASQTQVLRAVHSIAAMPLERLTRNPQHLLLCRLGAKEIQLPRS